MIVLIRNAVNYHLNSESTVCDHQATQSQKESTISNLYPLH
ncbi:hypothetical protein VCHA29O37_500019 [Vibrio chagasii]|nr:hypothetical protein VCHA29O37_500019 [Vibrio chagasii]